MKPGDLPHAIGRYEVVDRLGHGGMGVVYRGRDPRIGREVAIKLMRAADDALRERFLQEAQSAGGLKHRNIVTIFDYGEHDGQSYIVMEFVEGVTLADQFSRGVALPLWRTLEIVDEVAAGLEHAHNRGVIHRDIKPANVMLDRDGVVKILDFGVARLAKSSMTQAGSMLGTPNYMSPEQVKARHVDRRSDIFAVGLLFYELLTYRQAFSGETPWDVMNAIVHGAPTPLRDLLPDVDPAIEAIVNTAIQKHPAKRYQTLSALGADLARVRSRVGSGIPPASPTSITVLTPLPAPPPRPRTPRATADRALRSKRRAERIDECLAEARRAYAEARYADAIGACEHALLLDEDDPRAIDLLEEAREAGERAAQLRARLAHARDAFDRNDIDQASRLLDHAAQLGPLDQEAVALQATVAQRIRERDEEQRQRHQSALGALARARERFANGRFESAIRAASEVLIYEPGNEEAQQLSLDAIAEIQQLDRKRVEAAAARAAIEQERRVFAEGRWHEAIESLARHAPPHELVTAALDAMRGELAEIERRAGEEQERRRREAAEAERRRQEDAASQAAADAVRLFDAGDAAAAFAALHAFTPPHEITIRALDDLRARVAAIDKQRREAERQCGEERRQQRAAVQEATARAQAALAQDAFADAVAALDAADAITPATAARKTLRARALAGLEAARAEHERRAREAVDDARTRSAAGDSSGAKARLEAFDPDHPLVREALVELNREIEAQAERDRLAQEEAARRASEERARLERIDAECRTARSELAGGNFTGALQRLRERAAADGATPELDALIQDTLAQQAAAEAMVQRQREVLRLVASAHGRIAADDLSGATDYLDAALAIDPTHARALAAVAAVRALQEEELDKDEEPVPQAVTEVDRNTRALPAVPVASGSDAAPAVRADPKPLAPEKRSTSWLLYGLTAVAAAALVIAMTCCGAAV